MSNHRTASGILVVLFATHYSKSWRNSFLDSVVMPLLGHFTYDAAGAVRGETALWKISQRSPRWGKQQDMEKSTEEGWREARLHKQHSCLRLPLMCFFPSRLSVFEFLIPYFYNGACVQARISLIPHCLFPAWLPRVWLWSRALLGGALVCTQWWVCTGSPISTLWLARSFSHRHLKNSIITKHVNLLQVWVWTRTRFIWVIKTD